MQQRSRLLLLPLVALAAFALLSGACAGVASPEGWASPALTDGLLLVAHEDQLFALDAETLVEQWAFPPQGGDDDIDPVALYGTPGALEGTVFIPTHEGNLYAVDAAKGALLWAPFETDGSLIGGVAVSEDTIYFGSDDGRVYAVDPASGAPRWAPFPTGEGVWSTPALASGLLYVTSLDGKLYALDTATGQERWFFETDAGIASPPVVDEEAGLVYVAGFDSKLRAIDLETHEQRWSVTAGNWFWNQPLLADGVLYAGSLDKKVYAIDVATGDERWPPFTTTAPMRSAPVLAGGVLIVIDRDGHVYGIDPSDGTAAFAGPLVLDDDVLADPLVWQSTDGERVLVVTKSGDLIEIDPATLSIVGAPKRLGG